MTVIAGPYHNDYVCIWHNANGSLEKATFDVRCLKEVKDD